MGELAYVGLGSNLGDRRAILGSALDALGPRRVSRVVETEPWGRADQPPFLNAVAEIEAALEPGALLARLMEIEALHGRVRTELWGPRTLDLDLLLYGDRAVSAPGLTVPHPRLAERRFVLEGLAELAPDLGIPGTGRTVRELLAEAACREGRP